MFANARKHGHALVCLECQAKGYSPKDVKTYRCGVCGEHGHLKFEQSNLKKSKSRGDKLLCQECRAKETQFNQTLKSCLAKKMRGSVLALGMLVAEHISNQTKNEHCIHHAMVRSDGQEEMSAFGKRTGAFWREHTSIERQMRPFKDRKHALAKVGMSSSEHSDLPKGLELLGESMEVLKDRRFRLRI